MVRKRTLDLERSLDRFLQTTLLALLASGYLALALSGELDRACLVAGALVLAARAAQLTGLVRFIVPERWASRATACNSRYSYYHHGPTNNPPTPAGNYTITVTGQSSNGITAITQNTTIPLTVQ